jgi:hypothetical protein
MRGMSQCRFVITAPALALSCVVFFTNCVFADAPALNAAVVRPPAKGRFELPTRLGTVRQTLVSPTATTKGVVLHIQDVHMNDEAQARIEETLAHLISTDRVSWVALEGAAGPLDLSSFQNYPYQDAIRSALKNRMPANAITGALRALLITPGARRVPVIGVDEPLAYRRNAQAYRMAASLVAAQKAALRRDQLRVQAKIESTAGQKFRSFHNIVVGYRGGTVALADYARALRGVSACAPLANFIEAQRLESKLNFTQVERERGEIVARLLRRLSSGAAAGLVARARDVRAGTIRPEKFYAELKNLCARHALNLDRYPTMNAYGRYLSLAGDIAAETLFQAMREREAATYAALAKTPEEKLLARESRRLFLAGKLLDFALSREEWREYRASGNVAFGYRPPKCFDEFYRNAEIRDGAMAENFLRHAQHRRAPAAPGACAVLITGGFHSRGIDAKLARAGYTVVSFTPAITHVDTAGGTAYLSVFAQQRTPLEKLFDGEKLFMAPPQRDGLINALGPILTESARLHPGADANALFQKLAPALVAHGFAFARTIQGWIVLLLRVRDRILIEAIPANPLLTPVFPTFSLAFSVGTDLASNMGMSGSPANGDETDIETIKFNPDRTKRLSALEHFSEKPCTIERINCLLYALSDPVGKNRQTATGQICLLWESRENLVAALVRNLRDPIMPVDADPRFTQDPKFHGEPNDPQIVLFLARSSSIWALKILAEHDASARLAIQKQLDLDITSWSPDDQRALASEASALLTTSAPNLKLLHFLIFAVASGGYQWLPRAARAVLHQASHDNFPTPPFHVNLHQLCATVPTVLYALAKGQHPTFGDVLLAAGAAIVLYFMLNVLFADIADQDTPGHRNPWQEGMRVQHKQFGIGNVYGVIYSDNDGKKTPLIVVLFPERPNQQDDPDQIFNLWQADEQLTLLPSTPEHQPNAERTRAAKIAAKLIRTFHRRTARGPVSTTEAAIDFLQLVQTSAEMPFRIGQTVTSTDPEEGDGTVVATPRSFDGGRAVVVRFQTGLQIIRESDFEKLRAHTPTRTLDEWLEGWRLQ